MWIILALLLLCGPAMAGDGLIGGMDNPLHPGPGLSFETPRISLAFPECPAGYTPVITPDPAAEFGGAEGCAQRGLIIAAKDINTAPMIINSPTPREAPHSVYGCQPNEERVLRSDFSIGCAKDVHPQSWH